MTPSEWREFEEGLAQEFGLERVPASGSVWHSKLDVKGNRARWSLKYTAGTQFPLNFTDIREALEVCYGPGGDGATPMWAFRSNIGDFVLMRKEDFKALHEGEVNFINETKPKLKQRKDRARTPGLLREEDSGNK